MKVILLADFKSVRKNDEIMNVSDGYKTQTVGTGVIGVTSMIFVFIAWLILH